MLGAVAEGCQRHAALFGGYGAGYFTGLPFLIGCVEITRQRFGRPAKAYAACFCGGYAFCLTLADVDSFIFSGKRKYQMCIRDRLGSMPKREAALLSMCSMPITSSSRISLQLYISMAICVPMDFKVNPPEKQ